MQWIVTLLTFCLSVNLACATAQVESNDSDTKTKWGYVGNNGPERWGQLSPAFQLCATGKQQSPINIKKKVIPQEKNLQFHYSKAPLVVMDNGLTTLNLEGKQTTFNDGHSLQLNFDAGLNETVEFAGKTYRLVELHFHSPSENQIRGQGYPLEIHFVHQDDAGHALVVGVWVKGGKDNKTIAKVLKHLPEKEGIPYTIKDTYINPARLIPKGQSYYSFMGSLTTPPCAQGIQWVVMADVITASPAQIVTIRKTSNGTNSRPIQALHKREVFFAE